MIDLYKEASEFEAELRAEYDGVEVKAGDYAFLEKPDWYRYGLGVVYNGEKTAIIVKGRKHEIDAGVTCLDGIKQLLREWIERTASGHGSAGRSAA